MRVFARAMVAVCAIALASATASAEGYVGGSLGSSAMVPTVAEDSINQWNAANWPSFPDCDAAACYSEEESSGAFKFFAGYRINPNFAVEGFIAYLGSFDSYANDGFGVDSYATAEVSTLGFAAVGLIPVSSSGEVSLLGKLGLHSWSAKGDIDLWDSVLGTGVTGSYDRSGTDMMGGIGVHIDFGTAAAMRVEFEYFAANTDYSEFGIGLLSVGGMFRF